MSQIFDNLPVLFGIGNLVREIIMLLRDSSPGPMKNNPLSSNPTGKHDLFTILTYSTYTDFNIDMNLNFGRKGASL